VKERPILFDGAMVRALIAGVKTQTRRVVRWPSWTGFEDPGPKFTVGTDPAVDVRPVVKFDDGRAAGYLSLPYGAPRDRLWVRETWGAVSERDDGRAEIDARMQMPWASVAYRADEAWTKNAPATWRPSIHMPRWASRLTLEVTEVRVQRLQDISEEDALAEGVVSGVIPANEDMPKSVGYVLGRDDGKCLLYPTVRRAFEVGWDSISSDSTRWAANPWVWAVSFRVVQP
jgi:hypothetical protein